MAIAKEWFALLGSLTVISALYSHYLVHSVLLFEILLILTGALLMIFSLDGFSVGIRNSERGLITAFFMHFFTERRSAVIITLLGFLLIFIWSIWKIFFQESTNLKLEDFIVTSFGLSLVLYYSGPSKFQDIKDFIVLYLMLLTIIFVIIWRTYSLIQAESYGRIDVYSEYYLITLPVVSILQFFNLNVNAVLNLSGIGLSNIIEYKYHGHLLRVGIGNGCSGLYSAGLFFSAFLAFVLIRYRRINRRIILALIIGFIVTWASNIIRMIVTITIGIKFGPVALVTFHTYFGIILFISILTVFWWLILKWLDHDAEKSDELNSEI